MSQIRVKTFAYIRHEDRILLEEIQDDTGRVTVYRPLGGEVEFQEKAEDALQREIREELGEDIIVKRLFCVAEELYVYNGKDGHEVNFIFECEFENKDVYKQDEIVRIDTEHHIRITARWLDPKNLPDGVKLVPADFAENLKK